jgi:alpha-L-glutamate ligase-like protein
MHWLLSPRRLARLGILGINRRNAACILDHNPRSLFPIVDDKLRMRELCIDIGVPAPDVYSVVESHSQLRKLPAMLPPSDFVVKPNRGSAGRGVLVVAERVQNEFRRHSGERIGWAQLRQHLSDVISGMYSLGAQPDRALIQYRVRLHSAFAAVAYKGIPDVRVIVYRGVPAMAMLRLPTRESNGRANLHQGGIGAGVELENGRTHHAVQNNRLVRMHPDTNASVLGLAVPYWSEILEMSKRVATAVGLGFIGIDIVIDAVHGPMLLEANARPGLAIQIANARGLRPSLDRIDAELHLNQLKFREQSLKRPALLAA